MRRRRLVHFAFSLSACCALLGCPAPFPPYRGTTDAAGDRVQVDADADGDVYAFDGPMESDAPDADVPDAALEDAADSADAPDGMMPCADGGPGFMCGDGICHPNNECGACGGCGNSCSDGGRCYSGECLTPTDCNLMGCGPDCMGCSLGNYCP